LACLLLLLLLLLLLRLLLLLWADNLKDGDPGEADVVERDGAVERIAAGWLAVSVVPVPVDAAADRHRAGRVADQRPGERPGRLRLVDGVRRRRDVTAQAAVDERRDLRALGHAAVGRAAADEVAPVLVDVIVRQIEPEIAAPPPPATTKERFTSQRRYWRQYRTELNSAELNSSEHAGWLSSSPTPTAVAREVFTGVSLFVCFCRTIFQKPMQLGSPNDLQMFHNETWKSIYFRSQKVKGQGHQSQNIAIVGHCTLLSAGFF